MGKGKSGKGFWIIKPKKNNFVIQFFLLNKKKSIFLKKYFNKIFV